jgi:pSer/pThr/pTyr-binding forkhead associated (FHA) protein
MASLVVIEGSAEGAHFPLTEPLVSVGRDDTCTFQVLDPLVSRKHLQVRLDAALGMRVAGDYRSAHGVFINGKQVVIDTPLRDGDKIRIGNTTLMYLDGEHADAPAALAAAKKKGEWKRSTLMDHE